MTRIESRMKKLMLKSEKMTNTREIKKNIKKYKHQTKVETEKKSKILWA